MTGFLASRLISSLRYQLPESSSFLFYRLNSIYIEENSYLNASMSGKFYLYPDKEIIKKSTTLLMTLSLYMVNNNFRYFNAEILPAKLSIFSARGQRCKLTGATQHFFVTGN